MNVGHSVSELGSNPILIFEIRSCVVFKTLKQKEGFALVLHKSLRVGNVDVIEEREGSNKKSSLVFSWFSFHTLEFILLKEKLPMETTKYHL